jgi:hypothetical protein
MQIDNGRTPWDSHDWKVKTVQQLIAGGGSRLAFTCRSCERQFSYMTMDNRAWAIDGQGQALSDDVTSRWLAEKCPRRPGTHDGEDRRTLKRQS